MSSRVSVLIVEDRQSDAELMLYELRRAGYEPESCRVETEAGYLADLNKVPDVILADYHLPQFDALRALECLTRRGLDIPFIVVTGSISEEIAVECMKRGATDYLLKDRLTRLGPAVRRALEQKRLRDEKRQAEQRTQLIIDSALDAVITIDEHGVITGWNPQAEKTFGSARDEVFGKTLAETIIPPEFREAHRKGLKHFLATGEGPALNRRLELSALHRSGEVFPVELTISPLRLGKGYQFSAFVRDITERKRNEEQLKASLKEKEVLLREIHHRVKNNLQIISSLLQLQSRHDKNKMHPDIFKDSQNRIKSMALIHEKLYQSTDLARIDFAQYLQSLATHLFRSYAINADAIVLEISAEDCLLGIDTAIPCALIVNELVTNALIHAFPQSKGKINIDFCSNHETGYVLTIRDNGIGLPETADLRNSRSLGWQLVDALVGQLGATIEISHHDGTAVKIAFQELKYKERR